MKSRILTILLIISIVLTCTITINNIYAAGNYNIVITASNDVVNYGEEVTVSFNLKDITMDPGIGAIMGKIEYDKTVFEKITSTSLKSGDGWGSIAFNDVDGNTGEGSFVVERENANSITIKEDNLLCNVTFKVKAEGDCSAKPGDKTTIKISNISASNGETDQAIGDVSGTLKIGETSNPSGAPVITGVTDGGKYTKPVIPIITDDDLDKVELYKDGNLVSGFASGTKINDPGSYKLIATDKAGNKTEVNFTIEKESHPDSKAYKVNLETNSKKIEVGNTVVLKVSVSDITADGGIVTFSGKIVYDQTVFEKIEASDFKNGSEWESITFNPNNGKFLTNVSSGNNINATSTVFTLTLKVLKDAKIGDTSIVLSAVNASNGKEDLYVADVSGTLEIVEAGSLKPTATPIKPTATPSNPISDADTTPPVIIGVVEGATYNKPVSPKATDTNLDTVELYKNGVKVTGYNNGDSINQDGTYRIVARDKAGNETAINFTVKTGNDSTPTEDLTPPVISGVTDGSTYSGEVTVIVSDDNLNRVVIYKDGAVAADKTLTTTSFTVKFSTNGTYRIVATDAAGNKSDVTFAIKIGTIQPTVTALVTTPTPIVIKTTPTPTASENVNITDTEKLPYAGPDDLILPAIYVISAMGAIAYIQYKRIKNIHY